MKYMPIKSVALAAMAVAIMISGGISYATDSNDTIKINVENKVLRNIQPPVLLAKQDVDEEYFGRQCDVKAVNTNNRSVHPGNDVTVSSNGTSVVLADVERKDGYVTEAEGTLTMGEDVTVSITKVGASKVYSGGFEVHINCPEPEPEPTPEPKPEPEPTPEPQPEPEGDGRGEVVVESAATKLPETGAADTLVVLSGMALLGGATYVIVRARQ